MQGRTPEASGNGTRCINQSTREALIKSPRLAPVHGPAGVVQSVKGAVRPPATGLDGMGRAGMVSRVPVVASPSVGGQPRRYSSIRWPGRGFMRARIRQERNGPPDRPGAGMVLRLDDPRQPGRRAGDIDADSPDTRSQVLLQIVRWHHFGVAAVDHPVGRIEGRRFQGVETVAVRDQKGIQERCRPYIRATRLYRSAKSCKLFRFPHCGYRKHDQPSDQARALQILK